MFKKHLATPFTGAGNTCVIELAYNPQKNDLKILRLVSFFFLDEAEAEIYSLSTDSWRKVVISMESLRGYEPNFGTIFDIAQTCIFFNEALHTVADSNHHSFILSFNVNDQIFREIMLPPNYLDGVPVFSTEPAVFKGSLAILFYASDDGDASVTYGLWRSMVWPSLGLENIWMVIRPQNS
uniref:F-box associated beta-propeller type 1 domain-containing protein n=1 Tax=Quercus lobata TaxID=97700 RepID=A0A7N2MMM5_QUELO